MVKNDISVLAKEDVFTLIGKEWMLVTAGNMSSYNTMTASWGGLGYLWDKPVAFVFIRPERYTHDFIEREDRMTLSFYGEEYRKALQFCGVKSGRNVNKARETGLTPVPTETESVTFAEARITLDCRKLFKTEMTAEAFLDQPVFDEWYKGPKGGGFHTIYVVEIENVYTK